ncbi:sigma E protease regulator RseP [Candidatus Photodesmus blepharus]|nr:sigma E protease regulator RseP [Candidatus Photodesmus blepharus]
MTNIFWNVASFVIALGILVIVHEFGHFTVARYFGVKIEKVSIGLGRSIFKKIGKDGTEYTLSIIPLGGYVQMLDSRVHKLKPKNYHVAFDKKTLWKRAMIVAAGPALNFVFAIFAYWLVFLVGIPAVKPIIGSVEPVSIAADAGLKSGMEIIAISDKRTEDWESVNVELISHVGNERVALTVRSMNEIDLKERKILDLSSWNFGAGEKSVMESLGFVPYMPKVLVTLLSVSKGGAGDKAGLRVGDTLLSINGLSIHHNWNRVVRMIELHPNQTLSLTIERDGEILKLALIPDGKKNNQGEIVGFAGIVPKIAEWPESHRFEQRYSAIQSILKSIEKTKQVFSLTIGILKKLIIGDIGLDNLSGPISIAQSAGVTAAYGFVYFLSFLALMSINLFVINLLPFPMLDGGHLLFLSIEAVIRRPLSENTQKIGHYIGGAIIFSLTIIAILNDLNRL